jgi:hypothetical protein
MKRHIFFTDEDVSEDKKEEEAPVEGVRRAKRLRAAAYLRTAIKTEVKAIKQALRAKPDWKTKVADPVLARRYALEATGQGASPGSVAAALLQLLREAVGEERFSNTLSIPHDDQSRDFVIDEDQEEDWKAGEVETWCTRKDIDAVRYVDGAVPEELRERLEAALDAIANGPDKDFHPGSDGMVPLKQNVPASRLFVLLASPACATGARPYPSFLVPFRTRPVLRTYLSGGGRFGQGSRSNRGGGRG